MKVFTDRVTRGTVLALLVHSILLLLIGAWLFCESLRYLKHPYGTPVWRIYSAVGGWGVAIVAGMIIVVLATLRLKKPFDGLAAASLSRIFKTLFVAEVVVVFVFGGMILDGGETQGRMLLWSLVLKLILLGLFGGAAKDAGTS